MEQEKISNSHELNMHHMLQKYSNQENAAGRRKHSCKWLKYAADRTTEGLKNTTKRKDCNTGIPWLARNCLKSAILISPTKTVLCGGGGVERGINDNVPFSVFPTSASSHATSKSPSYNRKFKFQKHKEETKPLCQLMRWLIKRWLQLPS